MGVKLHINPKQLYFLVVLRCPWLPIDDCSRREKVVQSRHWFHRNFSKRKDPLLVPSTHNTHKALAVCAPPHFFLTQTATCRKKKTWENKWRGKQRDARFHCVCVCVCVSHMYVRLLSIINTDKDKKGTGRDLCGYRVNRLTHCIAPQLCPTKPLFSMKSHYRVYDKLDDENILLSWEDHTDTKHNVRGCDHTGLILCKWVH